MPLSTSFNTAPKKVAQAFSLCIGSPAGRGGLGMIPPGLQVRPQAAARHRLKACATKEADRKATGLFQHPVKTFCSPHSLLFGVLLFLACLIVPSPTSGQTELASVYGRVTDQSGAVIVDAEVEIKNVETNQSVTVKTNQDGLYTIPSLHPGHYLISVRKAGFKTVTVTELGLSIQDNVVRNFALQVGSISETVTVRADQNNINTTDGSVSTVVDRQYVENMPLNGRSFQDLILLTPGVTTSTPQGGAAVGGDGEFSVNGQRTEANSYTVDGVSANLAVLPVAINGPGPSGSLPIATALGTTQGLVSVDALEEFRVQTSTYSAEFGRNPGGQFSFATRSGANQWHGTAFDYLRNNVFDANDWFNDYFRQPEPPLRQNDFGGTLGGPIQVPHIYNGRDKTFFFFSYEGLRLVQPQAASTSPVPTAALRASAPGALQAVLNAFPQVNCTPPSGPPIPNCVPDHGNGMGDFVGTSSNPSQIDATSVRFDHSVNDKLRVFFRFSDTPSTASTRLAGFFSPAELVVTGYTTRTYTGGVTSMFSSRISNELRLNYSSNLGTSSRVVTSFGGGQGVDLSQLEGLSPAQDSSAILSIILLFPGSFAGLEQQHLSGLQKQWNLVDTVSTGLGRHQLKLGFDYRRLATRQKQENPRAAYFYLSASALQANNGIESGDVEGPAYPVYTNFSAFAQDNWRLAPRLNLSMGLRWEVNPAPGDANGNLPYTVRGSSISTLALAPRGTPLWNTTWFNFAPRLGAAYALRNKPGHETVVRGGAGVFFDTGQQEGSWGYFGPGFSAFSFTVGAAFPLPVAQVTPPIVNPPVAPYLVVYAFPAHLQLPYTIQWNASVQQALGQSQALTLSYVAANGRRLTQRIQIQGGALNPSFASELDLFQSGLTSNYDALQIQYQRRLARGLQALASYTWSHSIDYGSFNAAYPAQRGNSDLDVRHSFTSAVSCDLPDAFQNSFARAVLHHWGLDDRFTARTSFPVTLVGTFVPDPVTGEFFASVVNLIPGQPIYLYDANCASVLQGLGNLLPGQGCPGGRAINPSAFCDPTFPPCAGSTAPRNFVRGFGAWQMDLAIRRVFPIHERLRLQFRAEVFNVFNHPNFGAIDPTVGSTTFGQAKGTLAQTLGVLSPLYQIGGPRSMQFALKLMF